MSHPAGVRGLKLVTKGLSTTTQEVAPRRGAWIETQAGLEKFRAQELSHPAGVRGLKPRKLWKN